MTADEGGSAKSGSGPVAWVRRHPLLTAVAASAVIAAVWAITLTRQHAALREEAQTVCHEDVYARYGGEASSVHVFAEYVGEPGSNRFEYELVDTDARNVWTCLARKDGDSWDLSVFKQD
ncbi:hypothetical protein [Cellulosimicrobium composti]|uniref:hypothetical protein n=1 Tax=Cellulosimicrobium composti TaxID=2672572 RepID=UPI0037B60B40